MSTNIYAASRQWSSRPDDQRYTSLEDLQAAVSARQNESWTATPSTRSLRVVPESGGPELLLHDPAIGQERQLQLSHWSFGQLSQYAKAPASYLRSLPSELAAINLQWGIENSPLRDESLVLGQSNGSTTLRAMTSVSYGRIWDSQVVDAVQKVNHDGSWQIPAASYSTTNPKRATTLYASDRDVFLFLVQPDKPIEVDGETMFRGFYCWNSEVGSATFGLSTFLYRYVCDNRIIWGATDIKELRIRHTGAAPQRFAYEGAKYLERYANESTDQVIEGIKRAKRLDVPVKKDQTVEQWLRSRGLTKGQAKASVESAQAEEGSTRSVWDVVNGITAYARSIGKTDERIKLEATAGKLMADVAK